MTKVPVQEAQENLDRLLARAEEGETIFTIRSGLPPVRLGPVQSLEQEEDPLPSLQQWREDLRMGGAQLNGTMSARRGPILTQYVDTSSLAAYYCPEPLSERAEERLRALRPPVMSWLTDVELHSALAKKVRRGELAEGDAEWIQDLFRTHVSRALYEVAATEHGDFV